MSNTATGLSFLIDDEDAWLEHAACAEMPNESFFVRAGHVIDEEVLNVCRMCPVRIDCLKHAYRPELNITSGYYGGLSPGQRRQLTLEEAIAFCAEDRPTDIVSAVEEDDGQDPIVYA